MYFNKSKRKNHLKFNEFNEINISVPFPLKQEQFLLKDYQWEFKK